MDGYESLIKGLENRLQEGNDELDKRIRRTSSQARYIWDLDQRCEDLYADPQERGKRIKRLNHREQAHQHGDEILTNDEATVGIEDIFTKIRGISYVFFRDIRCDQRFDKVTNCLPVSILHSPFLRDKWDLVRNNGNMSTPALVEALLSSSMAEMIFKDAFYRYKPEFREKLNSIYHQALNENFDKAVAWKASTAELGQDLNATTPTKAQARKPHQLVDRLSEIEKVCQTMLRALRHILKQYSPMAGSVDLEQLESFVRDLVDSAATLADEWHGSEFHLEVIDFQYFNRRGFHWHSESMHKYAIAFSPNVPINPELRYEIVGVISPGFIRYEKAGLDDIQEVVWEKASVLLAQDTKSGPMYSGPF
ncbi:hypothetical protein ABW21_db0208791 [Orbilia brochopaga]|nr:hypothetical protein ABW21_db0208791 [Drechslerella brochopaga]